MFYGPLLAGDPTTGTLDPLSDVITDDDTLRVEIGNHPQVLRIDRPRRRGAHAPAARLRAQEIPQGHPVRNASLDPYQPARQTRNRPLRRADQRPQGTIMPHSLSAAEEAQKVRTAANQAKLLQERAMKEGKRAAGENAKALGLMRQAEEAVSRSQQECCIKKQQWLNKAQKIQAQARKHEAQSKMHEANALQFRASAAELAQRARVGAVALKTYWSR